MAVPDAIGGLAVVEQPLLQPREQVVQSRRGRRRQTPGPQAVVDAALQRVGRCLDAPNRGREWCRVDRNGRPAVVVECPRGNAVDELRDGPGVVRKAKRQDLCLSQPQCDAAENANQLRAALEPRIRDLFGESPRVVVGMIRAVGVSAGRVEFDRQRGKAEMILKRHEVGAAAERFQLHVESADPALSAVRSLTRPLACPPLVVDARGTLADVFGHIDYQVTKRGHAASVEAAIGVEIGIDVADGAGLQLFAAFLRVLR